nr:MAG TPA: hypothetical protein [Caudoviricetes sp.]
MLSQRNPSLALFKVRILDNPVGLISLAGLEQSLKCIEY